MSEPATKPSLFVYLLGPFRVETESGVIKLATKPTAALLAYLVLHRNHWHERLQLATLFWGGESAYHQQRETDSSLDSRARTSLRKALSNLRKQLGHDILLDSPDGQQIQLNPDVALRVDVDAFRRAGEACFKGGSVPQLAEDAPPLSADECEAALALYRGELLQDFLDDSDAPWLEQPRAELRDLYLQLCLKLAEEARTRGEWARVVTFARLAQAHDPYNETAAQHLIVAYTRQGETERALRAYADLERVLGGELGTSPAPSTRALKQHIEQSAARPEIAQLSNLPTPLTPFLGRETELATLRRLAQEARLVTLVGTGGAGKTRLAIQLGRELLHQEGARGGRLRDGVWWVRLEELDRETGSVAQAIAQVLGVRGDAGNAMLDTLAAQLRDSHLLLVLDNCEHLLVECARAAEQLLTACPQMKLLATSRQSLHVPGEQVFAVPPLPLPQGEAQVPALEATEAVQFFMYYARHARTDFALRTANAPAVAQICRRLDGIPLALELAAARIKTLSADYIADHLDERFQLIAAPYHTVPRHQTLRAVLDWSYDLLPPPEQRALQQLSAFAARFTPDAATYVCAGDGAGVPHTLEELADKSLLLIEFDANENVRYRLLETIREYAREKLAAEPERLAATNARLAEFYLQFARDHAKDFLVIEDEWNNIAAGMAVAYENEDWQAVLDYGQSVTDALFARGLYTDARRIIPWVITAADREEEQERSLDALYRWGEAYIYQALYEDARSIMQHLYDLGKVSHDQSGLAFGLYGLGFVDFVQSRNDGARGYFERALEIFTSIGSKAQVSEVLMQLGRIEFRLGRYPEAERYLEQGMQHQTQQEAPIRLVDNLQTLALIRRSQGKLEDAEDSAHKAIKIAKEMQNLREEANAWYILAQVVEDQHDSERARRFYEYARNGYEQGGERRSAAYVADALCGLLTEMGELAQAEHEGRHALVLLLELGDEVGIIASARRLGIAIAKMNRPDEACTLWHEALERAKRINDLRVPYLEALIKEYCL